MCISPGARTTKAYGTVTIRRHGAVWAGVRARSSAGCPARTSVWLRLAAPPKQRKKHDEHVYEVEIETECPHDCSL